jgi:aspartate carbamoyltransferase regulatory subunit
MGKKFSVAAIKEGTVIDHIPAGQALKIIHLLRITQQNYKLTLGLHLNSPSMEYKDIIKIENRFLSEKEAQDIAVFAPNATINIIENYHVSSKITAQLPKVICNILLCPNPRCITQNEPIDTLFSVEEFKQKIFLRCCFCEKNFERDEIKGYRL